MKSLLLCCSFLILSLNSNGQVAIISASAEDCSDCSDLPNYVFEQLQGKFIGLSKVLLPTNFEEINDIFVRAYFGWDTVFAAKHTLQDTALFQKCNPGQRSRLTIFDHNGKIIYNDILARFSLTPDSIIHQANQQLLNQWLKKEKNVKLDDPYYTFLDNTPVGKNNKREFYFLNTDTYLPYTIWKTDGNVNVQRYNDITETEYYRLIKKLKLPVSKGSNWGKLKKLCTRSRVNVLSAVNVQFDPQRSELTCIGEFHFDYSKENEISYFRVIFTLDAGFNLISIHAFDRKIPESNYLASFVNPMYAQQFMVKDSVLHIKIYDPGYLPHYLPDTIDANMPRYTSAAYLMKDDTVSFLKLDAVQLHPEQISQKEYYYNNWSFYPANDSISGLIYSLHPNDFILLENNSYYHLKEIPSEETLMYAFVSKKNLINRITKINDDFRLYRDDIYSGWSEILELGVQYNPAFLYQGDSLFIISFLTKKHMKIVSAELN